MALFKRKAGDQTTPRSQSPDLLHLMGAKADPSDIDNVRAEWPESGAESGDMQGWSNGMSLYDQGPIPAQMFNTAEYMSRGFWHALYEPDLFPGGDAEETIRRMLELLDGCPPLDQDLFAEMAGKRVRLALAIMRQHSWQPAHLGGTGRIDIDLDTPRIRASLAFEGVDSSLSLEHFFGA